jgi:ferritin-like metal-binding protein YciE
MRGSPGPGSCELNLPMALRSEAANREIDMKLNTLRDLCIHELQDLHSAETQLVDALPTMASAATSKELKTAISDHLKETKLQLQRVSALMEELGVKPGKKCAAMAGILKEGADLLKEPASPAVRDAGIIASGQRVEHYEIAAYGTARAYAQQLGSEEAARMLETILEEEHAADDKLSEVAVSVNLAAMEGGDSENDAIPPKSKK